MKRNLLWTVVLLAFGLLFSAAMKHGDETGLQVSAIVYPSSVPSYSSNAPKINMNFGKMPLCFIPNKGQVDSAVAYYVQGKDKTLYFTTEGITIAMTEIAQLKNEETGGDSKRSIWEAGKESLANEPKESRGYAVKLDFVGANKVKPIGEADTGAVVSYFRGKPADWKTGLPTYGRIAYRNLWPGIDLTYYGTANRMKYEFVVHPGADPGQIRLAYRGATSVSVLADGRLEVVTPLGSFQDDIPLAYQEANGERVSVGMAYKLDETDQAKAAEYSQNDRSEIREFSYGFAVGDYDPRFPLVLDPVIFVYCGYIGGSSYDQGVGIAVDGLGNAYVTGRAWTNEASFPVVVGPDLTHNGGWDTFVAKVKADGTALVYCGYIGGIGTDEGLGIAVDGSGNVYIAGSTNSHEDTFPVVVGPDLTYNGLDRDAFVAKVNAAGTALIYCGYIGGWSNEAALDIEVDGSGNAYVTGSTGSNEAGFPVKVGPDLTYNGSDRDAFVAKVKADGTALVYCGYIGGLANDEGYEIAVDGSGNAYATGYTGSPEASFPVNVGPDVISNGGPSDAFVAKVKADGTALVYCGYIGGGGGDYAAGIAVDSSGNAYVSGTTESTEASFPVAVGPDLTHNGGSDAFVAKVKADGTALVYCGYIGGGAFSGGAGIAVDGWGNAYITGDTSHWDSLPVVIGPDLTPGGNGDAFVAKVNAAGTALVYCGYIGGGGGDYAAGIAVDGIGNAYVIGRNFSDQASFPVIVGPDLTFNGTDDAFVAKVAAFSKDDLLGTWSAQGAYYRNSDTGAWVKLGSPATMITAGDLDGDRIDDLIGIWPGQGGVWVKYSQTGLWAKLSTTADWIGVGDMNGDRRCDLLGTWSGQGVYYRNSVSGNWVKMADPATKITAGDLDGDLIDDLIGIWPAQEGAWVKYSKTGGWSKLSSTVDWITTGDMNGDGRADFLGTWTGQGVYYRNSIGGAWVKMATPATQIVAGEIDNDIKDDLLGMWPSQGGVWVKYSKTSAWSKLSTTADWIGAGKMRQLGTLGVFYEIEAPAGGFALGPSYQGPFEDLSEQGPLGVAFCPVAERNTVVGMVLDKMKQLERHPGPGEPGFTCVVEKNPVPQEGMDEKQPRQRRSRSAEKNRR